MPTFAEIINIVSPIIVRIAAAVAVLFVGRLLAKYCRKTLETTLQHTTLTESLISLFVVLTYYGILIASIMTALVIIGLPISSIIASFSVTIIVLAVALQQSLADLAATINFLLFRPFEVGHYIETSGVFGEVKEIQLLSTVLLSPDQKMHVMSNGTIQSNGLTNYSKTDALRLTYTFGIGYDSDAHHAKQIIADILAADERVLTEPAPQIFIGNLGDSSVDITVWPYVRVADYLSFEADIVEHVKIEFDKCDDITIPFPQRDVHLISENAKT